MAPRRLWLLPLLALVLGTLTSATAAAEVLQVTATGKPLVEVDPGRVVTTTFMVANRSSVAREVSGTLELPPGWTPVTREFPFTLEPGASDLRLASFHVPASTPAARYTVVYSVQDRGASGFAARAEVQVIVLPVRRLSVSHLDAPPMVFAGESYQTQFVVGNTGNATSRIALQVGSGNDLPYELESTVEMLEPGSSATVTLRVDVPQVQQKPFKHRVDLKALSTDDEQAHAEAASHVEVLPVQREAPDLYHRMPTWVTLRYAYEDGETSDSAFQVEWSGAGTLDEAGEHHVDFLARGPSLQGRSSLGRFDEYRLGYRSGPYAARIGDQQFELTELVEPGVFGRGGSAQVELGPLQVSAYHLVAPLDESSNRQSAARAVFNLDEGRDVGLQLLSKSNDDGANIVYGIDGRHPIPGGDLRLELAFSSGDAGNGLAHAADANGELWGVEYAARYLNAGREFAGGYSDRTYASLGLALPLNEEWRLNAFGRIDDRGAARRLPEDVAPKAREIGLGADWRFDDNTTFGLDAAHRDRHDGSELEAFDVTEETLTLRAQRSFERIIVDAAAEAGRITDQHTGLTQPLRRLTTSATFRYAPGTDFDAFVRHVQQGKVGGSTLTLGFGASLRAGRATVFDVDYRVDRRDRGSARTRHGLDLSVRHSLRNRHQISLVARHRRGGPLSETSAMLEYRIPMGLPVARRSDVGAVRGRVFDDEKDEPLAGLVLKLDGLVAVSDQDGWFTFPAVGIGSHPLTVDYRRVGTDRVVMSRLPLDVTVAPGQSTSIELMVDRSASVVGAVVLDAASAPTDGSIPVTVVASDPPAGATAGLRNLIIELRGEDEVHRRLTDSWGRFEFTSIRPGTWDLEVLAEGVPEGVQMDRGPRRIVLAPAAEEHVAIAARPRVRVIRMLDEGGTIPEIVR